MNDTTSQAVQSALRTLLAAAGSALVAKGVMDSATANAIGGAIMVLLPLVWGVLDKVWREQAAQQRELHAFNAGVASAAAAPDGGIPVQQQPGSLYGAPPAPVVPSTPQEPRP